MLHKKNMTILATMKLAMLRPMNSQKMKWKGAHKIKKMPSTVSESFYILFKSYFLFF